VSWDTRMVQIHVRVSVHDESGHDPDRITSSVAREATDAVEAWVERYNDAFATRTGVEVEVA